MLTYFLILFKVAKKAAMYETRRDQEKIKHIGWRAAWQHQNWAAITLKEILMRITNQNSPHVGFLTIGEKTDIKQKRRKRNELISLTINHTCLNNSLPQDYKSPCPPVHST